MQLSHRTAVIPPSGTLATTLKARELARRGRDIIRLTSGDPDFPTPPPIVEAAYRAMREGWTHYVPVRGLECLREALAAKLERDNGIRADPDREIAVVPSSKAGLFSALQALVNPGDRVAVLEPAWVSYAAQIEWAGGQPVRIALSPDEGYRLNRESLTAHDPASIRGLVLNTPCNPTGHVLSPEELAIVQDLADRYDWWVVVDEVYEPYVFDGRRHLSLAALPGMAARTVTVNGFSKAYAMTGWRLGYVVGPAPLIDAVVRLHDHSTGCAAAFTQVAAVTALEMCGTYVETFRKTIARRRDRMVAALNRLPGWSCPLPEGTFYVFAHVDTGGLSTRAWTDYVLEAAGVALTPGEVFGSAGEGWVRLVLAADEGVLDQAVERLARLARSPRAQ
jgi:aspartate aminotransferase